MTHPKAPYSGHGNMDKAAQYRGNWHKITPEEIPHLEALGLCDPHGEDRGRTDAAPGGRAG